MNETVPKLLPAEAAECALLHPGPGNGIHKCFLDPIGNHMVGTAGQQGSQQGIVTVDGQNRLRDLGNCIPNPFPDSIHLSIAVQLIPKQVGQQDDIRLKLGKNCLSGILIHLHAGVIRRLPSHAQRKCCHNAVFHIGSCPVGNHAFSLFAQGLVYHAVDGCLPVGSHHNNDFPAGLPCQRLQKLRIDPPCQASGQGRPVSQRKKPDTMIHNPGKAYGDFTPYSHHRPFLLPVIDIPECSAAFCRMQAFCLRLGTLCCIQAGALRPCAISSDWVNPYSVK